MVGSNGTGDESMQEILDYLHRHGIAASAHITTPSGSVGETLLNLAADRNADLLVMGGYSHSRLREALIGGTTRHIRSEEHTSELQSLMRNSYAVFCLKK